MDYNKIPSKQKNGDISSKNSMGKGLIAIFTSILRTRFVLFMFCVALTSCGVTKKSSTSSSNLQEKTETKKDSSTSVKVNKAIDDQVSTQVSDSGDPELDAKIDAILMGLNTQKSSGDNSYKFYYDKQLRELKAEFKVAQTKDSVSSTNQDTKSEKSFEQNIEEYVKKIVIPWWAYLIGLIFIWPYISKILFFIFPQLRGLKTLKDVVTPPQKPPQ